MSESPHKPAVVKSQSQRVGRNRWLRRGLLTGLAVVVCIEAAGWTCQQLSVRRLKQWCRDHPDASFPTVSEFRAQLVGWPVERRISADKRQIAIFSWPSLIRTWSVRARLSADEEVRLADAGRGPEADFDEPFLLEGTQGLALTNTAWTNFSGNPPVQAASAPNREELINLAKQAFAAPKESLAPGVVTFPIVDETGVIVKGGTGLAIIANYSTICGPDKRLALDPRLVRDRLQLDDCGGDGTHLNADRVKECLTALNVTRYVTPSLRPVGPQTELKIEFHGDAQIADSVWTVLIDEESRTRIPGLIARQILDHLEIPMSDEDRLWILTPQIRDYSDAEKLTHLLTEQRRGNDATKDFVSFVERNPECVAAWDAVLGAGEAPPSAVARPASSKSRALRCSSVRTRLAREPEHQRDWPSTIVRLLKLAPTERGVPEWHRALYQAAVNLNDAELSKLLLEQWRADGTDYVNQLMRGVVLCKAGWKARGTSFANDVSPDAWEQFGQQLSAAQAELQDALRQHPSGWDAHTEMLLVSAGLSLPWSQFERHFAAAVSNHPTNLDAFLYKQNFLMKRWFGNTAKLLKFADECLDNGRWDAGIPQKVPNILREAVAEDLGESAVYAAYRRPDVQRIWKRYAAAAASQSSREARSRAVNTSVLLDTLGGDVESAAKSVALIDAALSRPSDSRGDAQESSIDFMPRVFAGHFSWYAHLRDRVLAATDRSDAGQVAAIRVALADGLLDEADAKLKAVAVTSPPLAAELARCRRALELGRRLGQADRLEITPREAMETFAVWDARGCSGLDQMAGWEATGNELRWTSDRAASDESHETDLAICFPVGLRNCRIQGTLAQSGGMHKCQIHIHTQGLRTPYAIVAPFGRANAIMLSHQQLGTARFFEPLRIAPLDFRVTYGEGFDEIVLQEIKPWLYRSYDDVPSTFGFVPMPTKIGQIMSISDLVVERVDE